MCKKIFYFKNRIPNTQHTELLNPKLSSVRKYENANFKKPKNNFLFCTTLITLSFSRSIALYNPYALFCDTFAILKKL